MRKQTLRVLSSLMCLIFLASLFQAPLMAAAQSIPVRVGNQTLNVTPGQWVSVRSGTQITHYNVRFVDGKPVALEMSQYTKLIFGDAGTAGASVADDVAQASSGSSSTNSSTKPASNGTTTKPAGQTSQSSTTPSSSQANAGTVSDDVAQATSGSTSTNSSTKPATTGSTSKPAGQTSQSSSQSSTTPSSSQSTAGTIADDVAQAGAGSLADDVAQSTSGSTSTTKPVSQSSTTPSSSQSTAGTIADDVAQAGTAGSLADDVAQSTTTTSKTTTSTTKTTTWDPSKHPRDPQTGRFISQQEAAARGLNTGSTADDVAQAGSSSQSSQTPAGSTADDVAQAGTAGSTADDVAQAGTAGSTADDVAQAGTAGSTADDVAQAGTAGTAGSVADDAAQTGSSKPSVGDKFRAGYETGKGMTNQGVQNVKDSLKSGFSAKNLLITAGITVGVDLATQIMRGEKPSVKKALKTVASAEFVGGVGGAVLGAAAGSFFVPFLSAVPVVGGVLSALAPSFGSIVGSSVGAYVAGDLKNGKFSIREAFKRIDWVGVTGQAIGSTAGAALGSCLGPVGTIVGGMVGGYLGNLAAQKIAGMFRKDKPANMPEIAMPTGTGAAVGGGMITIGGDDPVVSTAAPVSTGNDSVTIAGNGTVVGDYESEVGLAYSKYQELYKLYNEMIRQDRKADALSVADAMNQAKREYDTLRTGKK